MSAIDKDTLYFEGVKWIRTHPGIDGGWMIDPELHQYGIYGHCANSLPWYPPGYWDDDECDAEEDARK